MNTADSSLPTVISGARVVTPAGVLPDGWVAVADGLIVEVGSGTPPAGPSRLLTGGWLLPAFIDLHVHGGGGHDVTSSAGELAASVAFHRHHGTTAGLVSLVTAPVDALCAQLTRVADRAESSMQGTSTVLGAHLEGPFLSPAQCGAHDPAQLLAPDRTVLARLIEAARGWLRCMTVAPELPDALGLIDDLVAAGVVAAVGHTDASYEQAAAAFDRGASLATHLFNGMRPIHHRDPGPVLAALDSDAACEVINDGVHVHPAVLREVHARGADRLVLVTDAMAAAGAADGRYLLGGQDVTVSGNQARLTGTGGLAGSTLTMDEAVRRAVADGLPVADVARAAATNPARMIGEQHRRGAIGAGLAAELVHLDDDFQFCQVIPLV